MTVINVGFVGAGARVDYYNRIIHHVQGFNVSGFITRSRNEKDSMHRFESFEELAANCDIAFVCVPHASTLSVVRELVKHDVHIVIETPIYDHELVKLARHNNETRRHKISVAENWPFRPSEVLKRRIVDSGVLGKINMVINDFRGYEYHAFAMMRSYDRSRPNTCVGSSFSTGNVIVTDDKGVQRELTENWDVGLLTLESGVRLMYNFNSVHSRAKTRGPRTLRVICTRGSVSSDGFDNFIVQWDNNGVPMHAELDVYLGALHGEVAGASINVAGEEFMWRSPVDSIAMTEEDLSIHGMMSAIRDAIHVEHSNGVVYTVDDAFTDSVCVNSVRCSHGNLINM